jgi:hypothetical protein
LDAERTQIRSDAEQVKNDRTTPSRTLLAGASFAAPLILSLYALDPSRYYVLLAFAGDILLALIMYKIYTSTSRKLLKLIMSTDAAFLLAIEKLSHFRDYFDMDTYPLTILLKKKLFPFTIIIVLLRLQPKSD